MAYISNSDRLNQRRHQIHHDHETHRETTESTKLIQEDELAKIVHRRVDPAPTLRQQDLPIIRSNSVSMRITDELRLEPREVLKQERCQVSIFTKMEKVLHVQGIDAVLGVVGDELVGYQEGLVGIGGVQTV